MTWRLLAVIPALDLAYLRVANLVLTTLLPLLSSSSLLQSLEKELLGLRDLDATARFRLTTPAANLGIRVTAQGTELEPLVRDDWLESEAARTRGARRRPVRGKSPRRWR